MKKMFWLIMSLFFVFAINQSCSSDEGGGGSSTPTVTSITLSSDRTSVPVGESVVFTVKTNAGQTVTTSSDIKVDNASVTGATFSTTQAGSYTVNAKYNNLTSNDLTITFTGESFNTITVEVSEEEVTTGETVSFSAKSETGADLTGQSTFLVNGNAISGTSYTPTAAGSYDVIARIGSHILQLLKISLL